MNPHRVRTPWVTLALLGALAACSDLTTAPDVPSVDLPVVYATTADSVTLVSLGETTLDIVNNWFRSSVEMRMGSGPGPSYAPSVALILSVASESCPITVTGAEGDTAWVDLNGNGIPDHGQVDYGDSCIGTLYTGGKVRSHGSTEYEDVSDGSWGWRLSSNEVGSQCIVGPCGDLLASTLNGSETLQLRPTLRTHDFHFIWSDTPAPGHQFPEGGAEIENHLSFAADPGVTFAVEGPVDTGSLTATGDHRWIEYRRPGVPVGNYRVVFTTTTPLHFGGLGACHGRWDAGVLEGHLAADPARGFRITYTGCDEKVVDVFGAEK